MTREKCGDCRVRMETVLLPFKGLKVEGLRCPKCNEEIFTEKQMIKLIDALEQKKLKEKYTKKTVRIGNSLGVIFPKDVVTAFNLESEKTRLDIRADKAKGKIEITVL